MALVHSDAVGVSVPSEGQPTSVAAVLHAAADLLEKPGAWTQGDYCRNGGMCVAGALNVASGFRSDNGTATDAGRAFAAALGLSRPEGIAPWNDAPGRTQEEVVAALREAARKADAAPGSGITGGDEGRQAEVNPSQASASPAEAGSDGQAAKVSASTGGLK